MLLDFWEAIQILKRFLIYLIKLYRKRISPMKPNGVCRFYPTCSQYALDAIEKFGAFRGTILFIARFLRCNPLFKGGFDDVPERFTLRPFTNGKSFDKK